MTDNRKGNFSCCGAGIWQNGYSAGNRSIGRSLVLYWLCMALAMLAATLLLLSIDGRSHSAPVWRKQHLQQTTTLHASPAQMVAFSRRGIELSRSAEAGALSCQHAQSLLRCADDRPLSRAGDCADPSLRLPWRGAPAFLSGCSPSLQYKHSRMGVSALFRSAFCPSSALYTSGEQWAACSCTTAGI